MAQAEPMTQEQLDQLYTSCLEAAVALLEQRGSFSPILFELRANDSIQSVAMLDMRISDRASDIVTGFTETLLRRAAAGIIKASAIASQGHDAAGGRAIIIAIRAGNYARDMIVPYRMSSNGLLRKQRDLTLGSPMSSPVANDVFVH